MVICRFIKVSKVETEQYILKFNPFIHFDVEVNRCGNLVATNKQLEITVEGLPPEEDEGYFKLSDKVSAKCVEELNPVMDSLEINQMVQFGLIFKSGIMALGNLEYEIAYVKKEPEPVKE